MTTIKTNAGGSSDVTLDDGSQTTAKNTVTISGNIKFTNSVYSQVTLSDGKQTTAMNVVDLSEGAGKVNVNQGVDNAGKVMAVDESGNVVPTAGYATESWVNQQIQTQIGTIETALAEV